VRLIDTRQGWWQKGFEQREDYDYEEIFSPVARMETMRLIIALAA